MPLIRVAAYCRVSTDHRDQANSFESQVRFFRNQIENHNDWVLHDIYADEGITGTSTKKRVAFNRMIEDARTGKFQLILTKEVSRFSRNILDTISYTRQLRGLGIGVIFVTDGIYTMDPDAELRLSIMASIAQEESRRTSSRVVWGQTRQMEKGVVFGPSLLGYDVKDGHIIVNPEGAEIVRLIFHKYAVEQVRTTEIARYLTMNGYCTYHGNTKWKSNTVIKILNNEKYVGDLVQKKTYTPDFLTHEKKLNKGEVPRIAIQNHHEPIISRDVWNLAQERLKRNNKHGAGEGGHSNHYVFSGKIKCGECGSSFVGRIKYLKDGGKVRRWSCGTAIKDGAARCDVGRIIRDDDAMQMLKTAIRRLPVDYDDLICNVTELALDAIQMGQSSAQNDPERLRKELSRLRQKKEVVLDAYFSQEISKEDMMTMTGKYERQLTGIQERLDSAVQRTASIQDSTVVRTAIQAELTAILNGETESEVFYKTILDSLTVYKDRHLELRLNLLPQVFHFT